MIQRGQNRVTVASQLGFRSYDSESDWNNYFEFLIHLLLGIGHCPKQTIQDRNKEKTILVRPIDIIHVWISDARDHIYIISIRISAVIKSFIDIAPTPQNRDSILQWKGARIFKG